MAKAKSSRGRPRQVPPSDQGKRFLAACEKLDLHTNAQIVAFMARRAPNLKWSINHVARLLAGERPAVDRATAIAAALQVSVESIFSPKHRNAKILSIHEPDLELPILGRVAAGVPVYDTQNMHDTASLRQMLHLGEASFAVRVYGDSMTPDLQDNDLVSVRHQARVEPGELGVAIIDGEAVVKRIYEYEDRVVLKSNNRKYQDIVVAKDPAIDFQIAGRVVGVVRDLKISRP